MRELQKIISGEKKCAGAKLMRLLLYVQAVAVYKPIINLRNRLYDKQWLKSYRLGVPVICVGNITAGGTGKTPMVVWLCRYLLQHGKKVALLSRGYKGSNKTGNDEIQMIRQTLPEVPVVIDPDRVRGGKKAIEKYHPDIIVLDDGFQHRRLRRDLDIVMIDCTCPFGYEAVLPRGLLREPLEQLRRADAIVLSRADLIGADELDAIKNRLNAGETGKLIACCRHQPKALFRSDDEEIPLSELSGRKVAAFCGIGNPESFPATLNQLGAKVIARKFLPDHVNYNETIVSQLKQWRRDSGADWLMTTHKDWVKLKQFPAVRKWRELHWLKIELDITEGREQLGRKIELTWQ
jgi:tetraacyldisaccharide 4'-kinase